MALMDEELIPWRDSRTGNGPLAGVRVVDLSSNLSGPFATEILAQQGADVIKIEPVEGEPLRGTGAGDSRMSTIYATANRGKRSLALDLKSAEGLEVVHRLIETADVFVHNFRYGVVDRLGLGPGALRSINKELIYAYIVGYGSSGPYRDQPVYDHVIQALAGYPSMQAIRADGPSLVKQAVVDKASAQYLAQAITAALFQRERTGIAAEVEVSMLDAALAFAWPDALMNHTLIEPEVEPPPPIAASYRLTPTANGWVAINTATAGQYEAVRRFVGREGVVASTRGREAIQFDDARRETFRDLRARLLTLTTEDAVAVMQQAGIPCAPLMALEDIHLHPQVVANGIIQESVHPILGPVRQAGAAATFSQLARTASKPARLLGEDSFEILQSLGYTPDEIERLEQTKVVTIPPRDS